MKTIFYIIISAVILTGMIYSCKKESAILTENNTSETVGTVPLNPYDFIDTTNLINPNEFPSHSLAYIHSTIFGPKCSLPGCHDGHFEPDFRTAQSTFNTTVFHPIIKNNDDEEFTYRVIPLDTALSVLHERITNCCFANINDRMPQDNIGTGLPTQDIENIENWILNGAPNLQGTIATIPNRPPYIEPFYIAINSTYDTAYTEANNRIDSLIYESFYAPSSDFFVALLLEDDSTALVNMQVNKLQLSTNPDDFSNSIDIIATYIYNPQDGNEFYLASIPTSTLNPSTVYYMKYTINDGDQANDTFFPTPDLPIQYKTYWSFITP